MTSIQITCKLQRDTFTLDIDTHIDTTGCTAIFGPSGAGKSTLLRILAGLETYRGDIKLNTQLKENTDNTLPRVGFIQQEPSLFPHMNVLDNLFFAHKRRKHNNAPSIDDVINWFEITHLQKKPCSTLSRGEQQRVALARALVNAPDLLLLDEPLASLDEASKHIIVGRLQDYYRSYAIPMILVTHNWNEVMHLTDNVVILQNGAIKTQGKLTDISSSTFLHRLTGISVANVLEGRVTHLEPAFNITHIDIGDGAILQVNGSLTLDDQVKIAVKASDISISLEKPVNSSILNSLAGRIEQIEPYHNDSMSDDNSASTNKGRCMISISLSHQQVVAEITQKSAQRLKLCRAQAIFIQVKSAALLK